MCGCASTQNTRTGDVMKALVATFFILMATTTRAQDSRGLGVVTAQTRQEFASTICEFSNLELPPDLRIYAAGGYAGKERNFQIDQSGHAATQFDVVVNNPKQPVALLLGAYEPTIWNISWTKETKIVAVLVSGYHRQVIAGLEPGIASLNSSYDNKGACGYFYVDKAQNTALNPMSRKLFKKPVDMVFPGNQSGKILIGEPLQTGTQLVTSVAVKPDSFRDQKAPLAGQAGIDDAVDKGFLRRATRADADAWVAALVASSPTPDTPPIAGQGRPKPASPGFSDAYVVRKKFAYPAGLYGANSVAFFIPTGIPTPTGNPGHSAIYDFNLLLCQGARC